MGELEHYGVKGMRWGKKNKSQDTPDNPFHKSDRIIRKNTSVSRSPSNRRLSKVSSQQNGVRRQEYLATRSLLENEVNDTGRWLADNGYDLSVDAALNALKAVIPKRRSQGSDIVNAIKHVNSQGMVSIRKMNASKVSKGQRTIARLMKSK